MCVLMSDNGTFIIVSPQIYSNELVIPLELEIKMFNCAFTLKWLKHHYHPMICWGCSVFVASEFSQVNEAFNCS